MESLKLSQSHYSLDGMRSCKKFSPFIIITRSTPPTRRPGTEILINVHAYGKETRACSPPYNTPPTPSHLLILILWIGYVFDTVALLKVCLDPTPRRVLERKEREEK